MMKRTLSALALLLFAQSVMAGIPSIPPRAPILVGNLPANTTPAATDLFTTTQSGTAKKLTIDQMAAFALNRFGPFLDARLCPGMPLTNPGSTNVTVALNACEATAAANGQALYVPWAYTVDYFRIIPGSKVQCASDRSAGFNQSSTGSGTPPTSDGQYATVAISDLTSSLGVTMMDCQIYGNKTTIYATASNPGNTTPIVGLRISNEGAASSSLPRHRIKRVTITNTTGDCFDIATYTRDSEFDDGICYKADGYGVFDGGADHELSNWNIGQSKYDSVRIQSTSNLRLTNIKAWGAGQYSTTAQNPDGSMASNFYIFKASGITVVNSQSQEAQGHGMRVEGQGSILASEIQVTNLQSDGDNGAAGIYTCFEAYKMINSNIEYTCGKIASGLFGTPFGTLQLSGPSYNNTVRVHYGTISSYAAGGGLNADSQGLNAVTFNDNDKQTASIAQSVASYTPRPDQHYREVLTLSFNGITVNNPPRLNVGDVEDLYFNQDSTGGRTITSFGSYYSVPAKCFLNTTPNAVNHYRFEAVTTTSLVTESCPVGNISPAVLANAGTSPTLVAGSTSASGSVTEGTSATGFQITFGTPYGATPICSVQPLGGAPAPSVSASTTGISVTNGASTPASSSFNYTCKPVGAQ